MLEDRTVKTVTLLAAPLRFASAAWRALVFLAHGRPILTPNSIREQRMAECVLCPNNEHGLCNKCACLIDAKTYISSEECPDTPPRWTQLG